MCWSSNLEITNPFAGVPAPHSSLPRRRSLARSFVSTIGPMLLLGTFSIFELVCMRGNSADSMSESEGIHGISTHDIQGLPPPTRRLRSHDGADSLSASRSSLLAADLCLARLRSVSAISPAQPLSRVLAGKAGGTSLLGHGRALAPDQTGRAARDRRRVPPALTQRTASDQRPLLTSASPRSPPSGRSQASPRGLI